MRRLSLPKTSSGMTECAGCASGRRDVRFPGQASTRRTIPTAEDFSTDIVGAPVLRITSEEATLFQAMSSELLASIALKMKALRAAALKAQAAQKSGR